MALSDVVVDGPLLLAAPLALAAGLVSFLSPCTLPLVPGYLSYVGGLAGTEVSRAAADEMPVDAATPGGSAAAGGRTGTAARSSGSPAGTSGPADTGTATAVAEPSPPAAGRPPTAGRTRVLAGAALFVLGFAAVFTAYGAAAGALGGLLFDQGRLLTVVLGTLTIGMGLVFAGVLRLPALERTARLNRRPAAGLSGAPLLGALFAIGWTPCIGPTLAAVLSLSANSATAGRGALLAFVYSLGLGLPFLAVAASLHGALERLAWLRRHSGSVMRAGGLLLVLIGGLQVSGVWGGWLNAMRAWIGGFGTVL